VSAQKPVIERRSFRERFLLPVGITLLVYSFLFTVAGNLGWIGDPDLYRALTNLAHVLLYAAYALSSLVLYPVMYFRGASLGERMIGCYATPLAYVLKEVIRVTAFFGLGESLYFALSQIVLGALLMQLGFMGVAEIVSRVIYRRRYGAPVKVITWGPVLGIAVTVAALYVMLFWEGGVHYFYVYQEGYKLLFQR
jgi:hypothetical protein